MLCRSILSDLAHATEAPFGARLHLFTGKGGVGKSTIVAALGRALARAGRRPLIVELGHRPTMEHLLEAGCPIGSEPQLVAEGLFAATIDPDAALLEYLEERLRLRALARRVASSAVLGRFFRAAPAVVEALTFDRIRRLLERRDSRGPCFDPILVDLDATGHARMLLELPSVFEEIAASGPIRELLDSFSRVFADARMSALHLVTIPSELVVEETIELYEGLSGGLVRLGSLIVNRVPPPPFEREEADLIERLGPRFPPGSAEAAALELGARRIRGHAHALAQLERLRQQVPLPIRPLPSLEAPGSIAGFDRLAARLGLGAPDG